MKGCLKAVLICFALLIGLAIIAGLIGRGTTESAAQRCQVAPGVTSADVPSLIGSRLDQGKQSLCSLGFTNVQSRDAKPGESRIQVDDSNWIIVSQLPNPDSTDVLLSTPVALGVVKQDEAIPGGGVRDEASKLPCTHLRNIEGDLSAGILTDEEVRQKLREVYEDSAGSAMRPLAESALAAITTGTSQELSEAMAYLGVYCTEVGY